MKDAALVLIKIKKETDFIPLYKTIHSLPFVKECTATRGDIDIFVKIQKTENESCVSLFEKNIKTLEGISEASIYNLISEEKVKEEIPSLLRSFVLTEIESGKLNDAAKSIKEEEFTESIDIIDGKFNFLAVIRGDQFIQIDKFIINRIMHLDGIIKIKEYPVIDIYGN